MQMNRTSRSLINTGVGSVAMVLEMIGQLVLRSMIVRLLVAGDLLYGVNQLFVNIISTLSIAELGVANVIGFSLYKPIAEHNQHDIIAMIDNSPMYTYVLNDYYTPVFGDYTRGTVRYNLPALPEGKHQLLFRAWDIKNNSSTQIVDFEVVDGLVVSLDITCTNSPATDHTMFILTHDRPYAEVDVTISVYDYAGRVLWTHQESGMAEGNYYYVDWDLKTNSGQPLVPGIYLYRATISSGGSKESTQSRKIVVVGQ